MMSDIYERIAIYCEENGLFEVGDGVIAGLSGGADSVFLLHVLAKLQERWKLRLCAVHVHHGIRQEEADRDQKYAEEFAKGIGVPCKTYCGNVPDMAKEWHMSEEEAGRTFRYQCFENCRIELGFQKIAVAHHQDDQAETILFQMLRGSSLRGMGGMLPKRGKIVRPLLEVERREIEKALEKEAIAYCTDHTNLENIYARNILRNQVIPFLQSKVQTEAAAHIAHTGRHLREVMEYVDAQTAQAYDAVARKEDGRIRMELTAYQGIPDVIKRELILRIMQELAGKKKDLTSTHVQLVMGVFGGETGKSIDLPYGLRAYRAYQNVYMERGEETRQEASFSTDAICMGQEYDIPFGADIRKSVLFQTESSENFSKEDLKKHCTKCFDYDRMVTMPRFRYPEEGDYLWLDQSGKSKKLSRLFIDKKIPVFLRESIVVLAEGHHILWVPALERCSAYYYVSENTKKIMYAHIYE